MVFGKLPRRVTNVFFNFCVENGLQRSGNDACLYIEKDIYIREWVDDLLVTGTDYVVVNIITKIETEFNTKNLGDLNNFLRTEVERTANVIKLKHFLLKRFSKNSIWIIAK